MGEGEAEGPNQSETNQANPVNNSEHPQTGELRTALGKLRRLENERIGIPNPPENEK